MRTLNSTERNIRKAFLDGEEITSLDAMRRFRTNLLTMHVQSLIKSGMKIKSKPMNGSRYYIYYLDN
jgi:hypothetical protein